MGHYESSAKRKVYSISAHRKKMEKSHFSDLTVQLKALEQKEQTYPEGVEDRK